jgi:hypothetical protein
MIQIQNVPMKISDVVENLICVFMCFCILGFKFFDVLGTWNNQNNRLGVPNKIVPTNLKKMTSYT